MKSLLSFQFKAIYEIKTMLEKARELHAEYYAMDDPNTSSCYHCPLKFGLDDKNLCLWETLEAINDDLEKKEEENEE